MKEIIELSERTISLSRNEYLKVKGTIDTNIYHVQSGSLRIFVFDDDKEQVIRFGYKGSLLGALESFLSGKPSALCIQAIKKTTVQVIPKARIVDFLKTPQNKDLWYQNIENVLLQQIERELDLLTSSPKERYHRVLRRSPQLFQEIPHKHIANYLRMSPETLSRLKSLDLNQDL
jgi:CRP-like cAMP-binding protein